MSEPLTIRGATLLCALFALLAVASLRPFGKQPAATSLEVNRPETTPELSSPQQPLFPGQPGS